MSKSKRALNLTDKQLESLATVGEYEVEEALRDALDTHRPFGLLLAATPAKSAPSKDAPTEEDEGGEDDA